MSQPAKNPWLATASLNGFLAVIMGAVAAHAIPDPQLAALAAHASLYQLIHAVLLAAIATRPGKLATASRILFLAGILLFCGSLSIKALTGYAPITHLAPTGGASLMIGWLLLLLSALKQS